MWQEPGTVEPWAAWTEQDGAPDLCPEPTAQCDVETAGPGAAGKSITGLGAVASLGYVLTRGRWPRVPWGQVPSVPLASLACADPSGRTCGRCLRLAVFIGTTVEMCLDCPA